MSREGCPFVGKPMDESEESIQGVKNLIGKIAKLAGWLQIQEDKYLLSDRSMQRR